MAPAALVDATAPTVGDLTGEVMAVEDPMVEAMVVAGLVAVGLVAAPNAKDHIASLSAFSPHQNVILLLQLNNKINQRHTSLPKRQGKHHP
jgi:hypothetical protein